jgi:uncharacterized membrane protein SpoIIM required for sporulation
MVSSRHKQFRYDNRGKKSCSLIFLSKLPGKWQQWMVNEYKNESTSKSMPVIQHSLTILKFQLLSDNLHKFLKLIRNSIIFTTSTSVFLFHDADNT